MIVALHKDFEKSFKKLPPKIKQKTIAQLALFKQNPWDPKLYNHPLRAEYQGYRSISIAGDYRAFYRPVSESKSVFTHIGTHAQLYG